jgi:hypothetical protein
VSRTLLLLLVLQLLLLLLLLLPFFYMHPLQRTAEQAITAERATHSA